ncbi:PAS domain S-box protein, partial [archaeon]
MQAHLDLASQLPVPVDLRFCISVRWSELMSSELLDAAQEVDKFSTQSAVAIRVQFEEKRATTLRDSCQARQQLANLWKILAQKVCQMLTSARAGFPLWDKHGTRVALARMLCALQEPDAQELKRQAQALDTALDKACQGFTALLQLQARSIPVLREFASFLLETVNDEARALQLLKEADDAEDFVSRRQHRQAMTAFMFMDPEPPIDSAAETTGVLTMSMAGRIQTANNSILRMFGYTSADLLDRHFRILFPSPVDELQDAFLQKYLASGRGEGTSIGAPHSMLSQHRAGWLLPLVIHIVPVSNGLGALLARRNTKEGHFLFSRVLGGSAVDAGSAARSAGSAPQSVASGGRAQHAGHVGARGSSERAASGSASTWIMTGACENTMSLFGCTYDDIQMNSVFVDHHIRDIGKRAQDAQAHAWGLRTRSTVGRGPHGLDAGSLGIERTALRKLRPTTEGGNAAEPHSATARATRGRVQIAATLPHSGASVRRKFDERTGTERDLSVDDHDEMSTVISASSGLAGGARSGGGGASAARIVEVVNIPGTGAYDERDRAFIALRLQYYESACVHSDGAPLGFWIGSWTVVDLEGNNTDSSSSTPKMRPAVAASGAVGAGAAGAPVAQLQDVLPTQHNVAAELTLGGSMASTPHSTRTTSTPVVRYGSGMFPPIVRPQGEQGGAQWRAQVDAIF